MTTHMRAHTDEDPFTCKICRKYYPSNGQMAVHMRTHTGEKPFKCDVCGKCFAQKSNLSTHMKIHTQEKPFKFEFCQKSFLQKRNFANHLRTPTCERRRRKGASFFSRKIVSIKSKSTKKEEIEVHEESNSIKIEKNEEEKLEDAHGNLNKEDGEMLTVKEEFEDISEKEENVCELEEIELESFVEEEVMKTEKEDENY